MTNLYCTLCDGNVILDAEGRLTCNCDSLEVTSDDVPTSWELMETASLVLAQIRALRPDAMRGPSTSRL